MRSLGTPRRAAMARKSTLSTSDSTTSSCSCRRRRTARSRSSSITVSRPRRSTRGWVRAIRPGPISTMDWPGRGSMALTMPSMMPSSVRKFWPKRLRGMCFIEKARRCAMAPPSIVDCRSRSCSGVVLLRRLAVLDVGAATQLLKPGLVVGFELALAHHVANHVALLARRQRSLAALDELDQVHTEARDQRVADLAGLQRIEHLLELGHELAGRGPAQVAAVARAAVLRELAGQRFEAGLAAVHAALVVGQALGGIGLGHLVANAQQDVTRMVLRDHGRHAGLRLLQHLEHVKARARTEGADDAALRRLAHGLGEQLGIAVQRAHAHGAAALAVGHIGELLDHGQEGALRAGGLGRLHPTRLPRRSEDHTS